MMTLQLKLLPYCQINNMTSISRQLQLPILLVMNNQLPYSWRALLKVLTIKNLSSSMIHSFLFLNFCFFACLNPPSKHSYNPQRCFLDTYPYRTHICVAIAISSNMRLFPSLKFNVIPSMKQFLISNLMLPTHNTQNHITLWCY